MDSFEGIRDKDGKLIMDFTVDDVADLLQLTKQELFSTEFHQHVYRFGYKFKDDVSSKDRTRVIRWIKGLDPNDQPTDAELYKLISRPLGAFNKEVPFVNFDCVVYPDSKRTKLVQKIVYVVNTYLQHDVEGPAFSMVKSLPSQVQFDWAAFNRAYPETEDRNRHNQVTAVANKIIDKVHNETDYFSIASSVPPKYRIYVKNYLTFSSEEARQSFESLQAKQILVIDDVNTTGATLYEILRVIATANTTAQIYIFTLIGKEFE